MFERFTDRARRAVVLAQDEARLLGHNYIGTEHILLGILRGGDGVAARALTSLGVTLDAAREQIGQTTEGGKASSGHIPFTPPAKRSLELALREAMQLGCDYIGTEHILLGLIREDDSGAQALAGLGTQPGAVRLRVMEMLPVRRAARARVPVRIPPAGPAGRPGETGAQLESLAQRLAAVEERAGMAPDLAALDAAIARVRSEKEAAIDAHDFRHAEELSDRETGLLVDRDAQAREWTALPSLSEQVSELRAELAGLRADVERLRAALRERRRDTAEREDGGQVAGPGAHAGHGEDPGQGEDPGRGAG
jgi:hypothetical protein